MVDNDEVKRCFWIHSPNAAGTCFIAFINFEMKACCKEAQGFLAWL